MLSHAFRYELQVDNELINFGPVYKANRSNQICAKQVSKLLNDCMRSQVQLLVLMWIHHCLNIFIYYSRIQKAMDMIK